jgi:hypothetical protein
MTMALSGRLGQRRRPKSMNVQKVWQGHGRVVQVLLANRRSRQLGVPIAIGRTRTALGTLLPILRATRCYGAFRCVHHGIRGGWGVLTYCGPCGLPQRQRRVRLSVKALFLRKTGRLWTALEMLPMSGGQRATTTCLVPVPP